MTIKVSIFHPALLKAMDRPQVVNASGSTVGECLEDLIRQYPAIKSLIFERPGRLARTLFIFVNAESLGKIELTREVREGDVLILAQLISGG